MRLTRIAQADGGLALSTALSLADAKAHLSVMHATDDAYITTLCEVARAQIEGADGSGGTVGCTITRHMFDGVLEAFPAGDIVIRPPPLVSVSSVKYYDYNGALQTASPSLYHVVSDPQRPYMRLVDGASWPATARRPDAVTVRFTAGPSEVPAGIMHALRLHVGHLYLNREIALEKSLVSMPMGYEALVSPYRKHGWI